MVSTANWKDESFGTGVDAHGSSIADFCWSLGGEDGRVCAALDFRNDEPARKKPHDRRMLRAPYRRCSPAEFFGPAAMPARVCLGCSMFDVADTDGDPDATDRGANTPAGAVIGGNGCSAAQFCSAQSCRRAGFLNDEPFVKKPGGCVRTQSKPRACAAATAD